MEIRFSATLWRMEDQWGEEVRNGVHCTWHIHDHIVIPVKDRRALLDDEMIAIIRETATEIAERLSIELEAIGTDRDYIHRLCSAHPKTAPGRIVQMCKSITVREIFRRQPAVKRVLCGVTVYCLKT